MGPSSILFFLSLSPGSDLGVSYSILLPRAQTLNSSVWVLNPPLLLPCWVNHPLLGAPFPWFKRGSQYQHNGLSVTKIKQGLCGKCSEWSLISHPLPDSCPFINIPLPSASFPHSGKGQQARAQSTASVSSPMSVRCLRLTGPSAQSLSPAAELPRGPPGGPTHCTTGCLVPGPGPCDGTHVPMGQL